MSRLLIVSALSLLFAPNEAEAQFYLQSVTPGAYTPLATLPGIQNVTPFGFTETDEGSATVTIPFTYSYLGSPFTQARVAVNGYVVFGQNTDFGTYVNQTIGSPNGADNVIAVWWDDLVIPATDGYASTGVLGTAPNRIFIIEVREWEHYSLGNISDGNWQVWLYEGTSGRFEVRVEGALDAGEGYSATAGWEGPNGAPYGAFLPCSETAAFCDNIDFASLNGNVYSVELAQGPELLGSVGVFPRGALPGGSAAGQVTLRNVGTQTVNNVESELYLSLDADVDANDVLVGTFTVPQLQAGNVPVTVTATVVVPAGTAARDWMLLLSVDSNAQVAEVDEANNVAAAALPFATARDLSAVDAFIADGANPGGTVSIDIEIANQGIVYAGAVAVRVYASSDQFYDANDVSIASQNVNLAGAASQSFTLSATLPNLAPGSYYPVLRIDPNNTIVEFDEVDNTVVGGQPFPVGPELIIATLTSPGGANPGQPITFGVTVQNDGVPYSGNVEVRFIASPDPIYDLNDPVLGTTSIALTGLFSETRPATITMPPLPAGVYYPIGILDPNDLIDEGNDFNNSTPSTDVFTSGPEFSITDIDGPTQATPGLPMNVSTLIASSGAPYTGQLGYRLYLSPDRVLDPNDTVVGTFTVTLSGQAALADARTPIFPQTLPPTGHYLIGVVDPNLAIAEAVEGNNTFIDDQRIGSGTDLSPYSVDYTPDTAVAGDVVTIDFTLGVAGSPINGPVAWRISLSEDGSPDASDIVILEGSTAVNGEGDYPVTATVAISAEVPPASYEFIVEVDPDNLIAEPSETNNYDNSFFEIDILGPNLIATLISAPAQAFVGIPYRIELTLTNAGPANSPGFRYGYYISTNGLLRPPDGTEIAMRSSGPIAAQGVVDIVDLIDIPPQPEPSRFVQFGVVIDLDNVVNEADEADNVTFLAGQVQILVPVPDLLGRIDETSPEAAAGEDLAVTRTLENLGVASSAPFTVQYVLSANAELSAVDDIAIASFTTQLAVDEFDRSIDVVNLPATVPPGLYYLGMILDPTDALLETDETNNAVLGPQLRVYEPALTVATDQLPAATVGAPYSAQLFAAGPIADRSWSVTSGSLPAGIALDPVTGALAGTPTLDGLYPFTARITAGNAYAERELALRVRGATVPIEVVSAMLPYAIVSRPYRTELIAVGGSPPYVWGVRSTLPPGLTVTSTGGISGTPTQTGSYALAVVVTDSEGAAATADVALNVIRPDQTVAITQTPLPVASLGLEYCTPEPIALYASGGLPPYVWSALSGLPAGMTFSAEGALCGAPTEAGEFPLLVRAQDTAGVFDTSLFILRVRAESELTVTVTSLPEAKVGEEYLAKLTARQGAEPYRWRLFQGALPSGLALSEDGTISGTPAMVENAVFAVEVSDAALQVRLQPLSIQVVDGADSGCGCTSTRERAGSSLILLIGLVILAGASRLRRL